MIFLAWWLLISGTVKPKIGGIFRAYGFHLIFSVLPIAINHGVSHMNWMLYDTAGGVPLIESLCEPYENTWTATLIMAAAYFGITVVLTLVYMLLSALCTAAKKKMKKKMKKKR